MGNAAFMGLPYSIDERALIPRQDTELLAELALSHIAGRPLRVLDVGTGPGTLALALAKLSPARVTALDISRRALSLANAQGDAVAKRCHPRPAPGRAV